MQARRFGRVKRYLLEDPGWASVHAAPVSDKRRKATAAFALALLSASILSVAIAPAIMPDSYSWVEHSISESGGQGVEGAWMVRSGFLFAGFAVLLLAGIAGNLWGFWGRAALRFYGVSVIAAGTFAHGPWEDIPFDRLEGFLHTGAAFFTGLGFVLGVLAVSRRRGFAAGGARALDWLVVVAVIVIPVTMLIFTGHTGIQQRFMVLIGYAWLVSEGLRVGRSVTSLS
jgi:hypothetical protein